MPCLLWPAAKSWTGWPAVSIAPATPFAKPSAWPSSWTPPRAPCSCGRWPTWFPGNFAAAALLPTRAEPPYTVCSRPGFPWTPSPKFIVLALDSGFLTIHLGMTGRLLLGGAAGKHTHAIFTFDRGRLLYNEIGRAH